MSPPTSRKDSAGCLCMASGSPRVRKYRPTCGEALDTRAKRGWSTCRRGARQDRRMRRRPGEPHNGVAGRYPSLSSQPAGRRRKSQGSYRPRETRRATLERSGPPVLAVSVDGSWSDAGGISTCTPPSAKRTMQSLKQPRVSRNVQRTLSAAARAPMSAPPHTTIPRARTLSIWRGKQRE
jgi:hypothetical protein